MRTQKCLQQPVHLQQQSWATRPKQTPKFDMEKRALKTQDQNLEQPAEQDCGNESACTVPSRLTGILLKEPPLQTRVE